MRLLRYTRQKPSNARFRRTRRILRGSRVSGGGADAVPTGTSDGGRGVSIVAHPSLTLGSRYPYMTSARRLKRITAALERRNTAWITG